MKFALCVLALSLRSLYAIEDSKTWGEWAAAGTRLAESGSYLGAAQAYRRALVEGKASGIPDGQLVKISSALATAYADAGEYLEAETEWRHALVLVEKTEGVGSLDYALLAGNVALLPTQTDSHEGTISLIRMALHSHERSGPRDDLARLRGLLTQLLIGEKKYGEAEALISDVQAHLAHLKPTEHGDLPDLLNYLGEIRYQEGHFAESAELFREEVAVLDRDLGREHPLLVVPLNDFAMSLAKVGRWEEAGGAFERASLLCSAKLGSNHPTCAGILGNYSFVLRKVGRKREAKAMAARSKEIERSSGRRNGVGSLVSAAGLRGDRK